MTVELNDASPSKWMAVQVMDGNLDTFHIELEPLTHMIRLMLGASAVWVSVLKDEFFETVASSGASGSGFQARGTLELDSLLELRTAFKPQLTWPDEIQWDAEAPRWHAVCPFISENGTRGAVSAAFCQAPERKTVTEDVLLSIGSSVRALFDFHEEVQAVLGDADRMRAQNDRLNRRIGDLQESHSSLQISKGQLETQNVELRDLAELDSATGLLNQRVFYQELERRIQSGQPLAVGVIDIDSFKAFNDTYGHLVGDKILRLVGGVVQAECGIDSLAARYGGEEFAVIFGPRSAENSIILGEQIRKTIDEANWEVGHVTVSIGIAALDPTVSSAKELFLRADRAMYASKRSGKNRVLAWS